MADISTEFMGIPVTSPVILGASSLSSTLAGIRKAEAAGAGAVVLKSLFEEQLRSEIVKDEESLETYAHPEARAYLEGLGMETGTLPYLRYLEEAAGSVSIPVIASINAVQPGAWSRFASQLSAAGAKGLELNIGVARNSTVSPEDRVRSIVREVRRSTDIPLGVKLSPSFQDLGGLAKDLSGMGVSTLVLFNRHYQLDIDLASLSLRPGVVFSTGQEYHETLRGVALLAGAGMPLCASGGIHDWQTLAKMILAGASAVQVCSVVYRNGHGVIQTLNEGLSRWMDGHGFKDLASCRGRLAASQAADGPWDRFQYIKALTHIY